MPEKLTACVKCGGPVEQPPTGRPPIYCGPGCRKAAAYEIQRVNRLLQTLEERASRLRHEPDLAIRDWLGRTRSEARAAVEAEIADAESRLRLLLTEATE